MVIPVWCRSFRAQAVCWAPYSGHRVMSLLCSSESPAVRGSNGRALLSMCFRAGAADFWQRLRFGVPIAWICMDLLAAKSFGSVVCASTECSYGYFTAPPQSRVIQSLAVMELDLWRGGKFFLEFLSVCFWNFFLSSTTDLTKSRSCTYPRHTTINQIPLPFSVFCPRF